MGNDPFPNRIAALLVKIRLQDGATIKAGFTSRVSGSQLFLIVYEQYYREGVSCEEVIQTFEQKYGEPDDLHKRPSGAQWATYGLVSAIEPPDTAFGPVGAFLKTHVTASHKTGYAEQLVPQRTRLAVTPSRRGP